MMAGRLSDWRVIAVVLALACGAGAVAATQDAATGEVYGRVVDVQSVPPDNSVPGVTITIDGRRLSAPRTATTTAAIGYRFPDLPAGTYVVRVTLKGFRTATRENVVVTAGGRTEANLDLKLRYTHDIGVGLVETPELQAAYRAVKAGEVGVWLNVYGGGILIAVDTVHAPITSANFLKYVDGGFYNQGRFHRVTRPDNYDAAPPDRPMMEIIQGGPDPFRFRESFPPIPLERTSVTGLKHVVGTVSMARGGPDTATSDFFICLDDQPSLDFGGKRFPDAQGAAAFGRVVYGMDVVRKIQQERPMRPDSKQYLLNPLVIVEARRFSK